MKTLKRVDIGSFVLYGAVVAAFWTFVFGLVYWILGWLFGAQSWFIDMNLGIWSVFTMKTLLSVVWRALINGVGGAIAGAVIAVVYNIVAGMMGGLKLDLE